MSDTFTGHELESGLLQRVRRWRDALPVLVLVDALRVAGSPLYVGLSLVAVLISRQLLVGPELWSSSGHGVEVTAAFAEDVTLQRFFQPLAHGLLWVTDFRWLGGARPLDLLRLLGLIGIWAFPAATLARAGACYAAGRDQSLFENARVAIGRLHWVWLVAIVPLAIVFALGIVMAAVGWLATAGRAGLWMSELAAVLALPIVILIGLIAAGAIAAIPLAWAAMVVEKRCDTFDSLSRGYEYLFRRPVQLLFYSLCSYTLAGIIYLLATAVSSAALAFAAGAAAIGSGGQRVPQGFQLVVGLLPLAAAVAALWALIGAMYLLMRQSANQQEIEDIAVSPVDRRVADLPTLQSVAGQAELP